MAKYSKRICKRITDLVRKDSYTIAEICRSVGIAIATYYEWQDKHPEFAEALREAKDERMQMFVIEAKRSLLRRLQGYEASETKVVTIPSKGDPTKPTIKEQSTTKKHVPPDTTAIIFTLTNGDPTHWRNRQTTELTGKDGKDLFKQLTDEELDEQINSLEKKLGVTK